MTVAGFRVPTPRYVDRLRGGARPRSYRGTRPRFASGTLMSLRTAPTPLRAIESSSNALNRDSPPPPHTQNIQPPGNRLNRDSPPPPQFARHGTHTKPPRIHRNPGGTAAHPEYRYTQRCIYPLPQHQVTKQGKTVSPVVTSGCPKRSEDGSPVGTRANTVFQASKPEAKRIICTSHNKTVFIQGTQKSRRFRRISGIFFEVRPLGLEPRTH